MCHCYTVLLIFNIFNKSYVRFWIKYIILPYFHNIIINKKFTICNLDIQKSIQIKPHYIGSDQVNFFKLIIQNKPTHIILSLDQMSFCFKNDSNRTTNTLTKKCLRALVKEVV